ncbi:MAG: hypothetical protein IJC99_06045 [Clostridia bacterium]|nr:hypothetical protein [Clostridia bacterium]
MRFHRHFLRRITKNTHFRVRFTLYFSLTVNTAYSLFQLALGLYLHAAWFYALTLYYLSLTLMRFLLLRDLSRTEGHITPLHAMRRYRFCGIVLATMTPTLFAIVGFIIFNKRPLAFHSISTVITALYTLCAFAVAVYGGIRYRKGCTPLISAAKAVSLTTASVSLLSLEATLLYTFFHRASRRIILVASGTAVCLLVLTLSLQIIRQSTTALREYRAKQG